MANSAHTPNAQTIAAMKEADKISKDRNVKKYSGFMELLKRRANQNTGDNTVNSARVCAPVYLRKV